MKILSADEVNERYCKKKGTVLAKLRTKVENLLCEEKTLDKLGEGKTIYVPLFSDAEINIVDYIITELVTEYKYIAKVYSEVSPEKFGDVSLSIRSRK